MKKILVVEDDAQIREIEVDYLKKEGYKVIETGDGNLAFQLFNREDPDLVILDLNLPGLDGIQIAKRIRRKSGVPIIMVTARTREIDELLGLEVGADDYLKKPFSPKILVSRVKALLKRPELKGEGSILEHGDLMLNIEKRTVSVKGKWKEITTVQFNILHLLMSNPGRVFERYELIDKSYQRTGNPDIFDRTMDSHIKNIRKQIEIDPKSPLFIITVRGVGYKFNENL